MLASVLRGERVRRAQWRDLFEKDLGAEMEETIRAGMQARDQLQPARATKVRAPTRVKRVQARKAAKISTGVRKLGVKQRHDGIRATLRTNLQLTTMALAGMFGVAERTIEDDLKTLGLQRNRRLTSPPSGAKTRN
jgi:hypothetical protein